MRIRTALILASLFTGGFLSPIALGQNVADYGSIDNPYLLLLREPAVLDDLKLTATQRTDLERLNARLDGPLLALRNQPPDKAGPKLAELFAVTQAGVEKIFSQSQRGRLDEIIRRVRGIRSVLAPDVAGPLKLGDDQRQAIEAILAETRDEIAALVEKVRSGTPAADVQEQATQARRREQRRVLAELTDAQKRTLVQLLGREFDAAGLGRTRFEAPEFDGASPWINSNPLTLEELRGKVVVVHFWAFGCINCQRNFPWYRGWQESFAGRPVAIVGIHTPETEAERNVESLRSRVEEAGFRFPVVVDNDKNDWNAWGNSMWPSVYLIDKRGWLRYWWYGELDWKGAGGQKIMEQRIEELLAE